MTKFKNFSTKKRLIIESSNNSEPIPLSKTIQTYIKHKRNLVITSISLFLVAFPLLTNATIFQSKPLKNIFNTKEETIADIEKREHNSQTALILQAATNLDPNPASGGADLNIIDEKALIAESGVSGGFVEIQNRKNDQISVYEVKEGDSISQIANMFEVSVNTIKWANGLTKPISPGDQLIILPISGVKHTVKSGGTITDIAHKYKADPTEIALFNGVSIDEPLKPGQEIIVPNVDLQIEEKKPTKALASSSKKPSSASSSWLVKPVRAGYRSQGLHGHNSIDFAAPAGTPIYAAATGVVIISKSDDGWNGGYGNYVVLKHSNGVQTLYSHLKDVYVSVGDSISQNEQVGTVGNTGKSTGNHLHFEVRGAKNQF